MCRAALRQVRLCAFIGGTYTVYCDGQRWEVTSSGHGLCLGLPILDMVQCQYANLGSNAWQRLCTLPDREPVLR